MQYPTLCFIGAGNMAGAIIGGLVTNGYPADNIITSNRSPDKLKKLNTKFKIRITQDNGDAVKNSDVVIFAVKPAKMKEVCQEVASFINNQLILSVAAGVTIETIKKNLQSNNPMARVMPNTPCLIGKGAIGVFANEKVSDDNQKLIQTIFESVGEVLWVETENQINVVTALSGSGPAYFFYLSECLIQAGVLQGLSREVSEKLILKTAEGSTSMLNALSHQTVKELRVAVTSPKGTTEAALDVLQTNDFDSLVNSAIEAGVKRGIELSNEFE